MTGSRHLAALVLLAALLPPNSGTAGHELPHCPVASTVWSGSASCRFVMAGTPILVRGDSLASAPRVHVFITIDGNPEVPPLFECEGRDVDEDDAVKDGKASCRRTYYSEFPFRKPDSVASVFLRCNVEGAGAGTYYCETAGG